MLNKKNLLGIFVGIGILMTLLAPMFVGAQSTPSLSIPSAPTTAPTPTTNTFSFDCANTTAPYFHPLQCLEKAAYFLASKAAELFVLMVKIQVAILNFPYIRNTPFVNTGWPIVRDLCNMFFIVVLMMISFGTIFRIQKYSAGQHLLTLIIYAGLINFSLLITSLLIDVSNAIVNVFVGLLANVNLLGGFIKGLNLTGGFKLVDPSDWTKGITGTGDELDLVVSLILAGVVAGIGVAKLWEMILVLLKRIIVFWGTLAMSPILFIAPLLPGTQKLMSDWWRHFTEALVTGPVFAFFFYLVMQVIAVPKNAQRIQDQINALIKAITDASSKFGGP